MPARLSAASRKDGGAMSAMQRRILAMSLVAAIAGCSGGAAPTPAGSRPASPSDVATPSPPSSGATRGPVSEATFRAALDTALNVLMEAIGNPDTGASSEAMSAFDAALKAGDATSIRSTADVVLGILAGGQMAIDDVAGYAPGEAILAEWSGMLGGIAEGVTAMRDGGLEGSTAAVEAGRTRMGEALQDHFWPAIKGPNPENWRVFLADGRSAIASRQRYSAPVSGAFDGSEATAWTAGDGTAPQWIELDLGWPATIAGLRLLTFQDAPAVTEHAVTVSSTPGADRDLTVFSGRTTDGQWLAYTAATPVTDVRVVRVTTLTTTSMIGWREFEVVLAPGSAPSACPAGGEARTDGATVTGEPALPGLEPALAVDGDAATAWDPGDTRGPGGVRGWITVTLAHDALVSEVRLLLGVPAGGTAEYSVTGWPATGGRNVELGKVGGTTKDGEWRSVPGPTPCVPLRSFMVGVASEAPAAAIREIQVLGTAAP
jgi:hypothetical protein